MMIASLPGALIRRRPPPRAPRLLGQALTALLRRITVRNPSILTRLGEHAAARFLIDVRQARVLLVMAPEARRIDVHRRGERIGHDAAISGDLAGFIALLHRPDDDAQCYRGALDVSGDAAAVLALRRALDGAGLDLSKELAAIPGEPYRGWLRRVTEFTARRRESMLSRQEFAL